MAPIVKYIRHYVKHTIQSGEYYRTRPGRTEREYSIMECATSLWNRREDYAGKSQTRNSGYRAPEEKGLSGPMTIREQQQEANSSGTNARAMIGFQYTPITITYSDCNSEYF